MDEVPLLPVAHAPVLKGIRFCRCGYALSIMYHARRTVSVFLGRHAAHSASSLIAAT